VINLASGTSNAVPEVRTEIQRRLANKDSNTVKRGTCDDANTVLPITHSQMVIDLGLNFNCRVSCA
jgi:hypothetical protein